MSSLAFWSLLFMVLLLWVLGAFMLIRVLSLLTGNTELSKRQAERILRDNSSSKIARYSLLWPAYVTAQVYKKMVAPPVRDVK